MPKRGAEKDGEHTRDCRHGVAARNEKSRRAFCVGMISLLEAPFRFFPSSLSNPTTINLIP